MGLDVEFFDGDSRESILYLHKPELFFDTLATRQNEIVEDPYSDFWVYESDLDEAASKLVSKGAKHPRNLSELPPFEEIEGSLNNLSPSEADERSELDDSLLITLALQAYVKENGRIICAWSA